MNNEQISLRKQKSEGHLFFSPDGRFEYFTDRTGKLVFKAPTDNIIEIAGENKGYRCGRFECYREALGEH